MAARWRASASSASDCWRGWPPTSSLTGPTQTARRTLSGLGYAMDDIVMLIDDARAFAVQEAVAAAMARP